MLIVALVGWAATVGLVVWVSEMEARWTLAFMVSVPFIILVRMSWKRLRDREADAERER